MGVLVILGSARGDGDTTRLCDAVFAQGSCTRIDLRDLAIRPYEYDRPLEHDAFEQLIAAILAHQVIVFATPVYWYAMSGLMKVAFDRFTDLVTVRKDLGRQLGGRQAFLLACGAEPELPEGFEVPFRRTAEYLGMRYEGHFYAQMRGTTATTASQLMTDGASAFARRVLTAAT